MAFNVPSFNVAGDSELPKFEVTHWAWGVPMTTYTMSGPINSRLISYVHAAGRARPLTFIYICCGYCRYCGIVGTGGGGGVGLLGLLRFGHQHSAWPKPPSAILYPIKSCIRPANSHYAIVILKFSRKNFFSKSHCFHKPDQFSGSRYSF